MAQEEITENPLGTEKIGKLIRQFAIPAIISMLVSSLYNIVDQIFIGQGVGMLGNAATNVVFPLVTICTAIALMMGIGGASNYNLESGKGNQEKAVRIVGTSLGMLSIIGIVIMIIVLCFLDPLLQLFGVTPEVLPYAQNYAGITAFGIPFSIFMTGGSHLIRADQSPNYSMACMLTGSILNIILDPLFIFVFGWGIQGAATATVIGQVVSGLMVAYYFIRLKQMPVKLSMMRPRLRLLGKIISLGIASFINQISMALAQVVMNNTLRTYGADSIYGTDIPLACVGIIMKIIMVMNSICIGISQGCQPIWGYNYGAKKYDRVRKTYLTSFRICLAIGIVFFLAFQLFPDQIIGIFGSGDALYFQFARRFLRIYMFMTFLNGIQPMSSGFFTSTGKARLGICVSLTRQVIFLIPLILILPGFFGIEGVMYAGPISDGAACVVAVTLAFYQLHKMRLEERK